MSDTVLSKQLYKIHSGHKTLLNLLLQRDSNESNSVTLQVENEEFPVHRSILSAFSEYFFKMFTIDMKEKHSKAIKIEDVTAEAMKEILKALYDGEVVFTDDNLVDILHAASLLQITCVLDVAVEFMNHTMSSEKCGDYLELANVYSLEVVQIKAIQCLLQNFDQISEKESFLNLPIHQINLFLQSDQLNTYSEKRVFEFIVKWVNKDLEKRKQYFPQLFKHVRLQFIPIKFVVGTIGENELVKEFSECINLVLKAVSFYFTPTKSAAAKPRLASFSPDPDFVVCLSYYEEKSFLYNLHTKESKLLSFADLPGQRVLKDCAIANKQNVTILCGGRTSTSTSSTSSNLVFQFEGLSCCKLPSMNVARCGSAAAFYNEELYVFGGETTPVSRFARFAQYDDNSYASTLTETFETFEAKKGWKINKLCPNARSYGAAVAFQNKIILIGGYKPGKDVYQKLNLCKEPCDEVFIYNPVRDTWKKSIHMMYARAEFACTLWRSNVYVVGGISCGNIWLDMVEYIDLNNDNIWTIARHLAGVRPGIFCSVGGKMYTYFDGKIHIINGHDCKISKEENFSLFDKGVVIPLTYQ